ncbi:hypothetical protein C3F09_12890 [candidate division GN15 bacterium]|uniref:BlaI/MecI/CopY family transcriptional regulator n=1 Tax=candidate division GN15 bacterium TaxID=2072418 RepID=A0A855X1J9_9BACT|nr:MAG: hypothetical protein C3F09_12890 [candidate division GN15 bacterium]
MTNSFYFDPDGSGLTVFLGPTEARVMELVWKHRTLTVKKAMYHLGGSERQAYTTIMTVMVRLAEKGILTRRKEGRSFVYEPAIDREPFVRSRVKAVSDCLKRNFHP